ncbi:MAG: DUF4004 family protein [bacterium]
MEKRDEKYEYDDAEEISKKDILTLTGISYGQFYRWKRMGLIPEGWFRHRASFTGQETYLPRRRVLERIERIMSLRERYSLDDIVAMLSPDAALRRFTHEELQAMPWITPASLALFPGDAANGYDFNDLLCLLLLEKLRVLPGITSAQLRLAGETLRAKFTELGSTCKERHLSLLMKDGTSLVILHDGSCLVDQATNLYQTLDLNSLLDELKVHLRLMAE